MDKDSVMHRIVQKVGEQSRGLVYLHIQLRRSTREDWFYMELAGKYENGTGCNSVVCFPDGIDTDSQGEVIASFRCEKDITEEEFVNRYDILMRAIDITRVLYELSTPPRKNLIRNALCFHYDTGVADQILHANSIDCAEKISGRVLYKYYMQQIEEERI